MYDDAPRDARHGCVGVRHEKFEDLFFYDPAVARPGRVCGRRAIAEREPDMGAGR